METDKSKLITFKEFMKRLNIKKTKAYQLLRSGEINGGKIGSRWQVLDESINKYIDDIMNKN